jgi:putative Holliday junction resolvase
MRILGLDFGAKRIGVAISDALGITAQGVAVIGRGKSFEEDITEINKIIKKYDGVDEIVVGLPKMLSGELGKQADLVMEFVEALKKGFKINISTWDERLTTVEAERALISAGLSREKRRKVIDKSAAMNILRTYLDRKRR